MAIMMSPPRILLCRCDSARVFPRDALADVSVVLRRVRAGVLEVGDLCELAARKDPLLRQLAQHDGTLQIVACYPRAVKWLFASADASLPLERTQFFNLRLQTALEVTAALSSQGKAHQEQDSSPPAEREQAQVPSATWLPWFPVIDFDLCTNCMQCLSFCLFGVYGLNQTRQIAVLCPENCKTNCPACSRVCPEAAIIFPKFAKPPINGAAVEPEGVRRESLKTDVSAVLGGDLYGSLRDRSRRAQRFSPERDPQTALLERQRFLATLVEKGEIPASVLASFPPLGELPKKAARAAERAQVTLAEAKKP